MKKFYESEFLKDLKQNEWINGNNHNGMWEAWKDCLMECINTYASLMHIRLGSKKSLWIADNLRHEMRNRDLLKSKAASTYDPLPWEQTHTNPYQQRHEKR